MDPNQYVGEKDVSRMRQSMVARKADITKAGGIDKIWFILEKSINKWHFKLKMWEIDFDMIINSKTANLWVEYDMILFYLYVIVDFNQAIFPLKSNIFF